MEFYVAIAERRTITPSDICSPAFNTYGSAINYMYRQNTDDCDYGVIAFTRSGAVRVYEANGMLYGSLFPGAWFPNAKPLHYSTNLSLL